jgi:hypothetical protein
LSLGPYRSEPLGEVPLHLLMHKWTRYARASKRVVERQDRHLSGRKSVECGEWWLLPVSRQRTGLREMTAPTGRVFAARLRRLTGEQVQSCEARTRINTLTPELTWYEAT